MQISKQISNCFYCQSFKMDFHKLNAILSSIECQMKYSTIIYKIKSEIFYGQVCVCVKC